MPEELYCSYDHAYSIECGVDKAVEYGLSGLRDTSLGQTTSDVDITVSKADP